MGSETSNDVTAKSTITINIEIPMEMYEEVKRFAGSEDRSIRQAVNFLLKEAFDARNNQVTNGVFAKVLSAFVLTGRGPDHVSLKLDLPNAISYDSNEPHAHATIEATAGRGPDWVRDNCGIEPQVVNFSSR